MARELMIESSNLRESLLFLLLYGKGKRASTVAKRLSQLKNPFVSFPDMDKNLGETALRLVLETGEPAKKSVLTELQGSGKVTDKEEENEYENRIKKISSLIKKENLSEGALTRQTLDNLSNLDLENTVAELTDLISQGNREDAKNILFEYAKGNRSQVPEDVPSLHGDMPREELIAALREHDRAEDRFPTRIKTLDKYWAVPRRKRLLTYGAQTGGGKSWAVCHFALQALKANLKVYIVSLEMEHADYVQRMLQMDNRLLRDDRRKEVPMVPLEKNDAGVFTGMKPPVSLARPREEPKKKGKKQSKKPLPLMHLSVVQNNPKMLNQMLDELGLHTKAHLRVDRYREGDHTVDFLDAKLDDLAAFEGFNPDLVVVDYADRFGATNRHRMQGEHTVLTKIYDGLRGLAERRNCAVVTCTQVNRPQGTAEREWYELEHMYESSGKGFNSDVVLLQAPKLKKGDNSAESALGLARVKIVKCRSPIEGATGARLVMSQCLAAGQFCIEDAELKQFDTYRNSTLDTWLQLKKDKEEIDASKE